MKYLKCEYDQWDEAYKKASRTKKRKAAKAKKAKESKIYRNIYAR